MSKMKYNKGKLIPTEMGYKDLFELEHLSVYCKETGELIYSE